MTTLRGEDDREADLCRYDLGRISHRLLRSMSKLVRVHHPIVLMMYVLTSASIIFNTSRKNQNLNLVLLWFFSHSNLASIFLFINFSKALFFIPSIFIGIHEY